MFRGLFIAGTDTNVGKTVVSAALLQRYPHRTVRYWKPVQTGIELEDDTATVQELSGCGPERVLDVGVRLPRPVSPHLAARLNGTVVDIEPLIRLASEQPAADRWIVEGAGGVLVPLNERMLVADLIKRLNLPVVIVSRSGLGTINHTLLTIEALERRKMPVAGVVMVGPRDADNRTAIEHYGCVPVLGELPPISPLTAGALGEWARGSLDAGSRLMEHLA